MVFKILERKCRLRGVRLVYVPANYSSTRCPVCGYVDENNRHGDSFVCQHCRHEDFADKVGALNLLLLLQDDKMAKSAVRLGMKKVYEKEYLQNM